MPKTHTLTALLTLCLGVSASAQDFRTLWLLGTEDDNNQEFAQESQSTNAAPGSATIKDDDYYFAGTYPDPIGVVAENEPLRDESEGGNNTSSGTIGFERAFVPGDPNARIHFNLTQSEAATGANYRVRTRFTALGAGTQIMDPFHDMSIKFNDTEIWSQMNITEAIDVEVSTEGVMGVTAVAGPNVIEINRTGGTATSWIQFDFIELQIDESNVACPSGICNFTASSTRVNAGDAVTLSWVTPSNATVTLMPGGETVAAGSATTMVMPTANTTYTLLSTLDGVTSMQTVDVNVNLLTSFTASGEVRLSNPSTSLNWTVDPSDQVTLALTSGDQTLNIDGATFGGTGLFDVSPTETTTYSLTATRPNPNRDMPDVETRQVEVVFNDATIFNFNASQLTVTPPTDTNPDANLVELDYEVTTEAGTTVSIDNGIGDVTDATIGGGGFGFSTFRVTEDTTVTLTVTRPGRSPETRSLNIIFDNFTNLWTLGMDDDNQAEFARESGGPNDVADASATALDDDYFFAGNYPDSVGLVTADETLTDDTPDDQMGVGFERAVGSGDNNNRIHFLLTEAQAAPDNQIRFRVDLLGAGYFDADIGGSGGFGTHDVELLLNGNSIAKKEAITEITTMTALVSGMEGGTKAGENIFEVRRTGGDSAGNNGNAGWIQFDFLQADLRMGGGNTGGGTPTPPPFQITTAANPTNGMLTLKFPSEEGQTFLVETSSDLVNFSPVEMSLAATTGATETCYEIAQATTNNTKLFVRVTRN